MKRRKFLQVAGVTGAGLAAGCGTGEPDKWMPYLVPPEDIVPGVPTYYATTCRECPAGCGILVKTREGLPTKIEGNPQHPVNRGRLCARGQAALQGLYNPDRFTQPMKRTGDSWAPISWEQAETELSEALASAQSAGRDRIAFVSGAGSGPLDRLTDAWLTAFGSARRLRYEAFAYEPLREANRQTIGVATVPQHDFAAAHYILSFGADFLETWLSPTENARGFAASHAWNNGRMAKFVAVEPRRGMTGFSADEWIAPRPGTEHLVALAIANAIVRSGRSRATGGDGDALRGFLARFEHFAHFSCKLQRREGLGQERFAFVQDPRAHNGLVRVPRNIENADGGPQRLERLRHRRPAHIPEDHVAQQQIEVPGVVAAERNPGPPQEAGRHEHHRAQDAGAAGGAVRHRAAAGRGRAALRRRHA